MAESKVASYYSSKYKPFPTPEDLLFTSKDVSVIVPLLTPPKIMELCLKSWLKNQPHEVIFVTTFDYCMYTTPKNLLSTGCFCYADLTRASTIISSCTVHCVAAN